MQGAGGRQKEAQRIPNSLVAKSTRLAMEAMTTNESRKMRERNCGNMSGWEMGPDSCAVAGTNVAAHGRYLP